MAKMAAAAAAMHLLPNHAESVVLVGFHRRIDRRIEARPAGPAVELRLRRKERQIAAGTGEYALPLLLIERARKGRLGVALAEHGILGWRQQFPPFFLRAGHFEGLGRGF